MTWVVSSLSITGIKGVLDQSGTFVLKCKKGKPRSMAIFGRNGYGKSGYADAVEYLFSPDGEVGHLGKGDPDSEQGGKHALPHVLAREKGIIPEVAAEFVCLETGERVTAKRPVVTGRKDPRPLELEPVLAEAPAHRILRQHDLRRFVVDLKPSEKFNEFAKWVGIEGAARMLASLTTAENTMADTDVDREIAERLESIKSHTSGAVVTGDVNAILRWCEQETAGHTGKRAYLTDLADIDTAVKLLRSHREQSLLQSQSARDYASREALQGVPTLLKGEAGGIRGVEVAWQKETDAEGTRAEAQRNASDSVFQEVWQAAQKAIISARPDKCPVCHTPWARTTLGSSDSVLVSLKNSLESLAQFTIADADYQGARKEMDSALGRLSDSLDKAQKSAETLALGEVARAAGTLKAACANLRGQTEGIAPLGTRVDGLVQECSALATTTIPSALSSLSLDSSSPTPAIDTTITRLEGLKEALVRLRILGQQQDAIRAVEQQFSKVAGTIRARVQTLAQNAIDVLRSDVAAIYRQIHPGDAIPNVLISVDAENKTLLLRVTFHSADRQVPPGGYLSEAQINSLGLALFLSSVRRFNAQFPFVFLDDIVSSYDADCRARIVDIIAEYMSESQVFITTHDERFYAHLKQRLEGENWLFQRITGYEFETGPRLEGDHLRPDEISALIKKGDCRVAGNAVRQCMEEWFDKACDLYKVNTPHRREAHEYQRTLSDFWQPFMDRAEHLGAGFGTRVTGATAYQRLKSVPLINYYSHYQANPYEWSAIGDVQYAWETFCEFSSLFNCASCGKLLKYDRDDNRLYCTCGGPIVAAESDQDA